MTTICNTCNVQKDSIADFYQGRRCCKACVIQKQLEYYRGRADAYSQYYYDNRLSKLRYQRKYMKNRYTDDDDFKNKFLLRSRLYSYLNSSSNRPQHFGLSAIHFKLWIQYNIELDNLTDYRLDHVVPLSSYTITSVIDGLNQGCNHYTNIMPLSPEANYAKSTRQPTKQEKLKAELRKYLFCKKYNLN